MNEKSLFRSTFKTLKDMQGIAERMEKYHAGSDQLIKDLAYSLEEMRDWVRKLSVENARLKAGADYLYERYDEVAMIKSLREEIKQKDIALEELNNEVDESWCGACACRHCCDMQEKEG